MTALVGIATVTYNSLDTIESFLRSIRGDAIGATAPVVVVDNDSADADATREVARSFGAEWIAAGRNGGYGAGINRAVAELPPTEFVVICNPDTRVTSGALETLIEAARSDERIGAVGPRILSEDGSVYPSARSLPSLRTGIGHALLGRAFPNNPWSRRYHLEHDDAAAVRAAGWLSGSFLLVRRSVFEALGGFDDSYFMYFEDVDLGARIGRSGRFNVYVPTAEVVHLGAHSTAGQHARMLEEHHRSAYRYLSHRYRGWYLAPLRGVLRLGLEIRIRWLLRGRVPR